MGKRRRPWKVYVRSVGPSYTYATEDAAVARAERLTREEHYAEVLVYCTGTDGDWRSRRVFTPDGVRHERFADTGWVAA